MKEILKIENLSIGYVSKKKKIVIEKDINISINKPKLIALIGKNGIGKSTLLRTISGMQPSLKGNILINTKKLIDYNSIEISQKISIVLTERIPPSNLTVYELIALGRQVYTNWIGILTSEDKRVINDVVLQVKISSIRHKKIDELSDGQYQKVMIARALAQDTDIILLDEPTAHLDMVNKAEIFKLLKELTIDKKKTIIISSHELHLAIQTADDLWLMAKDSFVSGNKKELIKQGALQHLFQSDIVKFDKKTNQFIFI